MRWKTPEYGDKRIVTKFLLFPRTIDGETRWLERATIREMYDFTYGSLTWYPIEFIDDEGEE